MKKFNNYVIHPSGYSSNQSQSVKQQGSCLDEHLTKGNQPQTRQATPECTCPIRGSGSQTGYPRMHITRQALPGFNIKNTLDNLDTFQGLGKRFDIRGEATPSRILQDIPHIAEG